MTARVIAVCNQKGGVGKTTVTVNLAAEMAEAGLSVLVIDDDPQANATAQLALTENLLPEDRTLADVLAVLPATGEVRPGGALDAVTIPGAPWPQGIRVIPAELALAAREQDRDLGWESRLRTALEGVIDGPGGIDVDVVLIDCPPSVGLLTVNALVAADAALLVTEPRAASVEGLAQMVRTVNTVRRNYNGRLRLAGVVVNRHRPDRVDRAEWMQHLRQHYGQLLIDPPIPEREGVARAASRAEPLTPLQTNPVMAVRADGVREALQAIADHLLRMELS